jgi:hypothetical protein
MKSFFVYVGIVLILLNTLIGLILPIYSNFNMLTGDVIIIINMLLLYVLANSKQKDGFKISFSFFITLIAAIQFILALIMNDTFQNNFSLILILILFFTQLVSISLGKLFSKDA